MSPSALHFAHPWALLLLAAVPLAIWAVWLERRRAPRLRFPPAATLKLAGGGWRARLGWLPPGLVIAGLALTAVALARPQKQESRTQETSVEGIDIVIALDLSGSMAAADFQPKNRLYVAQEVLKGFIGKRRSDRIGLVTFASDAYTQCPLTFDYGILRQLVDGLRFGVIDDSSTAIGNALVLSVNRLRESTAKSKVAILITDGDNNAGQISPLQAAEIARSQGIKVFTILVGKGGVVPYPVRGPFGITYQEQEYPVNPGLLQEIARVTGGAYYNAIDRATLEQGLNDILDRLEKTRLFEAGSLAQVSERFTVFLWPAFGLAAAGILLALTRFRPFP